MELLGQTVVLKNLLQTFIGNKPAVETQTTVGGDITPYIHALYQIYGKMY